MQAHLQPGSDERRPRPCGVLPTDCAASNVCPAACSLPLCCSKQNEDRFVLEVADGNVEAGVPEVRTWSVVSSCIWSLVSSWLPLGAPTA